MKILIAEDDPVSRKLLETLLIKWGYDVVVTCDGEQAWEKLHQKGSPKLAILDWMMPGIDGLEVCRKARKADKTKATYIILITAKGSKEDIVEGLQAGADDYLTKPVNSKELQARLQVGIRILELQKILADRVKELEKALSHIKTLQGFLPICSYCKKIRNDQDYWEQVEGYIAKHSEVVFSHGICPDCYEKYAKPQLKQIKERKSRKGTEKILIK